MFNSFTTMLRNTVARLGNLGAGVFYDLEEGEALVVAVNRVVIGDITEAILKEHALIAGTFSDGYHGEFLVKKGFIEKNGDGAGLRVAINRSLHAKGWPLDKELVDTTIITTVDGVKRLADGFVKVTQPATPPAEWTQPYVDLFDRGVGMIASLAKRSSDAPAPVDVLPDVLNIEGKPSGLTPTQPQL